MSVYTIIYSKYTSFDPHVMHKMELHCSTCEADSKNLALYLANRYCQSGNWVIDVEEGDTKHLHPGAVHTKFLCARLVTEETAAETPDQE